MKKYKIYFYHEKNIKAELTVRAENIFDLVTKLDITYLYSHQLDSVYKIILIEKEEKNEK